jgi:hypothetical protein
MATIPGTVMTPSAALTGLNSLKFDDWLTALFLFQPEINYPSTLLSYIEVPLFNPQSGYELDVDAVTDLALYCHTNEVRVLFKGPGASRGTHTSLRMLRDHCKEWYRSNPRGTFASVTVRLFPGW